MKKFIILGSVLSFMSVAALATDATTVNKDSPVKTAGPSKEKREKMAVVHDTMAACLRTDKPIKECHKEMRKKCHDSMGKDGCPMMDKMGKGMMHHHGDSEESEAD